MSLKHGSDQIPSPQEQVRRQSLLSHLLLLSHSKIKSQKKCDLCLTWGRKEMQRIGKLWWSWRIGPYNDLTRGPTRSHRQFLSCQIGQDTCHLQLHGYVGFHPQISLILMERYSAHATRSAPASMAITGPQLIARWTNSVRIPTQNLNSFLKSYS